MINITNIGIRQMLLASALVIAASGEAWAQAAGAVIAQYSTPYFESTQDIYRKPPLGQFEYNMHLCVKSVIATLKGVKTLELILPSGETVYSMASDRAFVRNPAGDKQCESIAARAPTLAGDEKPVSNEKPISPDSATDPGIQADIKDFIAANPSRARHTDFLQANFLQNEIGDFFYTRGSLYYNGSSNLPELLRISEWSDDKESQDFVRARRWYQLVISQLSAANPELVAAPSAVCPPYRPSPDYCGDFFHAKWMIGKCDDQLSAPILNRRQEANEKYRKDKEDLAAAADTAGRVVLRHWEHYDKTDPLSGKVTLRARAEETDHVTGETIQAIAACHDNDVMGGLFIHRAEPSEDIQLATVGNNSANLLWRNNNSISVVFNSAVASSNYILVRYRFGVGELKTVQVYQGDYSNAMTLQFDDSDMSLAQNLGIELSLANGKTPVVEINPKDPILRALTETCKQQADRKDTR